MEADLIELIEGPFEADPQLRVLGQDPFLGATYFVKTVFSEHGYRDVSVQSIHVSDIASKPAALLQIRSYTFRLHAAAPLARGAAPQTGAIQVLIFSNQLRTRVGQVALPDNYRETYAQVFHRTTLPFEAVLRTVLAFFRTAGWDMIDVDYIEEFDGQEC